MNTITKKVSVADLISYPITNGLVITLVLFGGHLLGYVSDWAYEKDWWLLGAPIRIIEFAIQMISVLVILGVFFQWLKLIKLYLTNREVTVQHKAMMGRNQTPSTHDAPVRVSQLLEEIVTVFYDRIKLAILKNEGNYPSDSNLSINEKHIMDEVLYLQCLRKIYSKNARKQKCLTIISSWILESSENDNLLVKLESAEKAFHFANKQTDNMISELELDGVESLSEKLKIIIGGLVKKQERINKSPDVLRFMEKKLSYLQRISHVDKSLNAIISHEHVIDDCDLQI